MQYVHSLLDFIVDCAKLNYTLVCVCVCVQISEAGFSSHTYPSHPRRYLYINLVLVISFLIQRFPVVLLTHAHTHVRISYHSPMQYLYQTVTCIL